MSTIDLGYRPRPQQVALHRAIESHRWTVAVCHRRMGKTVAALVHLIVAALECQKPRPRFAYVGPTYRQSRLVAWDYLKAYTRDIPGVEHRESELVCNLPGERRIQLFGADQPDSLRGVYFDGLVLDEYGMQAGNVFSEVLRPALADRRGWALFLGTPNGHNQFHEAAKQAQADETGEWAYLCFKASETGILAPDELAGARDAMTADEYAQEFECSFTAAVRGSIYGPEIDAARAEGRVGTVNYDPVLPVDTTWDLGVGDATSIWFSQTLRGGEIRLIDYYEASGEGLPHYAQVLQRRGYTYRTHWAPHDIQVRELGTGRSRLEVAASLGIKFKTVPRLHRGVDGELEEGIHAVRMLLPKCWFDAQKTERGLEALQHYRRDFNSRLGEFRATPVHDWASHASDSFRYLAIWHHTPAQKPENAYTRPSRSHRLSETGWMGG
jgi:hypothetical protein